MARKSHGNGLSQVVIRDGECPECGVPSGTVCDRSGDPYSLDYRDRLELAGVSHYRRMLAAYGVPESRWDNYVARNAAGASAPSPRSVTDIAEGEVNCPVHKVQRGTSCPAPCPARLSKAALAARQCRRRAQVPVAVRDGWRHDPGPRWTYPQEWDAQLVREAWRAEKAWRRFCRDGKLSDCILAVGRARAVVARRPREFRQGDGRRV